MNSARAFQRVCAHRLLFRRSPYESRERSHTCFAKKKGSKGGNKKGGNKKGGSLIGSIPKKREIQPWQTTEVIMQHLLMIESYRRSAGKPLMENAEMQKIADVLFEAPFVLLAHNRFTEGVADEDAVFTYANRLALETFEAEWSDLVGLKSSAVTAELDGCVNNEREEDLRSAVGKDGVKVGSGYRRSLKGTKFFIEEFTLWNVKSPTGKLVGQAAWFDTIKQENGTVVKLGVPPPPSDEEIAAAQAAVEAQAAAVRALKAGGDKGNDDPGVADAVAELLRLKGMAAELEKGRTAAVDAAARAENGAAAESTVL